MNNEIKVDNEEQEFLSVRETYFVNPKKPIDPDFIQATTDIVKRLITNENTCDNGDCSPRSGILSFTDELTDKYIDARKFNENSMAQIHPNGFEPSILAHFAATIKNNNTIVEEVSPVESIMEDENLDWLNKEISGYESKKASGSIVEGGTIANITGLLIAREKLLNSRKHGRKVWDGKETVIVLANELAHYSISKACSLLGTASSIKLIKIPVDREKYTMKMDVLEKKIFEYKKKNIPIMAIVAVAGETETGIVDKLDEIANLAIENNIYLHVDGAYGAPFILSKKRDLFKGIDKSNSITVDPHKYLYTPYQNGVILFKDQEQHSLIERLNSDGEPYMFKTNKGNTFKERTINNHGKRRLSGSTGGQGAASLWAAINTLGKRGFELILNHNIDVTNYAYKQLLSSNKFNVICPPDLNTLCIYPKDERILRDLILEKELIEETSKKMDKQGLYISTTTLPMGEGKERRLTVFRMVITHPYTDKKEIDSAIEILHNTWEEIINEHKINNLL